MGTVPNDLSVLQQMLLEANAGDGWNPPILRDLVPPQPPPQRAFMPPAGQAPSAPQLEMPPQGGGGPPQRAPLRTGTDADQWIALSEGMTPSMEDSLHSDLPTYRPPGPPPAAERRGTDLPSSPRRQGPHAPVEREFIADPMADQDPTDIPQRPRLPDALPALPPRQPVLDPRANMPASFVPATRPLPPPSPLTPMEHLPPPPEPSTLTNPYVETSKQGEAPGAEEGIGRHMTHALLRTLDPFDPSKPGGQSLLAAGFAALGGAQGGEVVAAANAARGEARRVEERKRRDHARKNELRDKHTNAMRQYLQDQRRIDRQNAVDFRTYQSEAIKHEEGLRAAAETDALRRKSALDVAMNAQLGNARETDRVEHANRVEARRAEDAQRAVVAENANRGYQDEVAVQARGDKIDAADLQNRRGEAAAKEINQLRGKEFREAVDTTTFLNESAIVQDSLRAIARDDVAGDAIHRWQEQLRKEAYDIALAEQALAQKNREAPRKYITHVLSVASTLKALAKDGSKDPKRAGLQSADVSYIASQIARVRANKDIDDADKKAILTELFAALESTREGGEGIYTKGQISRAGDFPLRPETEERYPVGHPFRDIRESVTLSLGGAPEGRGVPMNEDAEFQDLMTRSLGPGGPTPTAAPSTAQIGIPTEFQPVLEKVMASKIYQNAPDAESKMKLLKKKLIFAGMAAGQADAAARQAVGAQ